MAMELIYALHFFPVSIQQWTCPLLLECHGSEVTLDWSSNFAEDRKTIENLYLTLHAMYYMKWHKLGNVLD